MKLNTYKKLVPYVVIILSAVVILTRPNSLEATVIFLSVAALVIATGIVMGRYLKLSYKPYIAILLISLVIFIVSLLILFSQEQPECPDYAVLCLSDDFLIAFITFIISGISTGYILGFLLPAVVIGKQRRHKRTS